MFDQIVYAVDDGVATITLNRPDRLNAYTQHMQTELMQAFDMVDRDDDVRAVIVTGQGRAFCAGADLESGGKIFDAARQADAPFHPDGSADYDRETARDSGGRLTLRIFQCLKPVIAAINGPAVGVGATMTLAMDVRLASEDARIGFVFARRGVTPEACSAFFLPRAVGIAQALEWCMTGRVFGADEAFEGGLVKRPLPSGQLMAAAGRLAREIALNAAPVSVALTRQMMWRGLGLEHPMEAHRIDSRSFLSRSRSADMEEGVASFLQKRPPSFPDRVSSDMPEFFPWWQEPTYS